MLRQVQGASRVLIRLCLSGPLCMTFVMSGNSRTGSQQPGVAGQWGSKTSFWGQPERREGVGGGGATTARPVLGWCGGGGVGEGRRCGPGLIGTLQLRSSAALPSDPALELPSAPVSRVPHPMSHVPHLMSHVPILCPPSHVPCPMSQNKAMVHVIRLVSFL